MSEACSVSPARRAASGPAIWLGLAATPTFAVMAVLSAIFDSGPMDMLCAAGHGSLISGMVPMYLLMAAFHLPVWFKLIADRGRSR